MPTLDSIKNQKLRQWIEKVIHLCQPTKVYLCDGSEGEYRILCEEMVNKKTFIHLNEKKRPFSFLARSNAADVARVEKKTFICSKNKDDAGPTNNWEEPEAMKQKLISLFRGSMKGRTLYIVPFSMGPLGSHISHIGVQITDSPYAVVNMQIMTRMGGDVLDILEDNSFVSCLHSVGFPLEYGQKDVEWPCNPEKTHIVHFPAEKSIWSFGSGYGGNALLGKKCFALRIASVMAKEQDWLAEHMLIVGITNPKGEKKYFAAAFPSACGKTNLAMMRSSIPGWKVETVGDDIAWMKFASDGTLRGINPEAGFFGVAPGTSYESNPNAMITCSKNSIFTNVALTSDGDVWWEGMTEEIPKELTDWKGEKWTFQRNTKAAHPNSRFTAPARQCPVMDSKWEDPEGVPISGIIFGGRRSSSIPLVYEALDWNHGVFMGCCVSSEMTAAAEGEIGKLRHDPFAMLPFCGYNMGDYFEHWLNMGKKGSKKMLPRIFSVNWFQKSSQGEFLWPGFGENIRVLKWMFERCDGSLEAEESPIGFLPKKETLDLSGLHISDESINLLLQVSKEKWTAEMQEMKTYLSQFGTRLPSGIQEQLRRVEKRLID